MSLSQKGDGAEGLCKSEEGSDLPLQMTARGVLSGSF